MSLGITVRGLAMMGAIVLPASLAADDHVGIPAGPVDVPSETLPPNQALHALQRQEDEARHQQEQAFIESQRGSAYFAFASYPAFDRYGQPVVDPQTHQQMMDSFCIVWRPQWVLDNPDLPRTASPWYTSVSFKVDRRSGSVVIYELKVPNGIAAADGFHRAEGQVRVRTNIVAPLFDQPQPQWTCNTETWVAILTAGEREFPAVTPWDVTSGDPYSYQKYRERQKQNCLANPQVYHGRC